MQLAEAQGRSLQENFELVCPSILSPQECAIYCEANPRTVQNWVDQGKAVIKKIEHQQKIERLAAVVAFLKEEFSFTTDYTHDFLLTPHVDTETLTTYTMLDILREDDGIPIVASYAVEQSVSS